MKVILLGDTNTDNTSIVLIGKDCKVITVSYTHLDVYKRQVRNRLNPGVR